jgi:hypothetical protein
MNSGGFGGLGIHLFHIIGQQLLDPIKRIFERDLDASNA